MFNIILKNLREEKGWSQNELAGQVYCSQSAIASFELGYRKPSIDTLKRIAMALNVSTDCLLGIDKR